MICTMALLLFKFSLAILSANLGIVSSQHQIFASNLYVRNLTNADHIC